MIYELDSKGFWKCPHEVIGTEGAVCPRCEKEENVVANNKDLFKDWPFILIGIVREFKHDEKMMLEKISVLIRTLIDAQRENDVVFFLPFQDEKKVELRKSIDELYTKIDNIAPCHEEECEILGIKKFIEKHLIF